jgi:aryl-alcohol dehydrogenase-like predicted oxidoreductase
MNSEHLNQQLRQLGQSNLWVSPVALGCWPIAGMTSLDVNDADSLATIEEAIQHGLNFLDTAHCYGAGGESELLIGQAIKGKRDRLVLASKGGIHWDSDSIRHYDGRPERIVFECEESLRRMQIETIDLYYLHAPDPCVPVAETATAFARLLESGKIRSAGVSNLSLVQMDQFLEVCPITAVQPPYNMLQRGIEADLIPWCQRHNASVINYWPLMKGLLAGKIRRGHQFDPQDKRLTYDVFQGDQFESAQNLLDGLDEIAGSIGKTVAQVVVNWTIHQPGILATLCGAKRAWQIRETAGALGWQLDEQNMNRISGLLKKFEIPDSED